eukprot:6173433-Pleurochrysis_carterae.AAC.1
MCNISCTDCLSTTARCQKRHRKSWPLICVAGAFESSSGQRKAKCRRCGEAALAAMRNLISYHGLSSVSVCYIVMLLWARLVASQRGTNEKIRSVLYSQICNG